LYCINCCAHSVRTTLSFTFQSPFNMKASFIQLALLAELMVEVSTWELVKRRTEISWHLRPPQISITKQVITYVSAQPHGLFLILFWLYIRSWRRGLGTARPTCDNIFEQITCLKSHLGLKAIIFFMPDVTVVKKPESQRNFS